MVEDAVVYERRKRIRTFRVIATVLVGWSVLPIIATVLIAQLDLGWSAVQTVLGEGRFFLIYGGAGIVWAIILALSFTNKNAVFLLGMVFGALDIILYGNILYGIVVTVTIVYKSHLIISLADGVFPIISIIGIVFALGRLLLDCRLIYDAYKIRLAPMG